MCRPCEEALERRKKAGLAEQKVERGGGGGGGVHPSGATCLWRTVAVEDLEQGQVGDCWLISAFAALAESPANVQQLFDPATGELARDGTYKIKLFHPVDRKWLTLAVDDRLPAGPGHVALSKQGELWPCLLEKAFAELFGGYRALTGNSPLLGLGCLTGIHGSRLLQFFNYPKRLGRRVLPAWRCGAYYFQPAKTSDPDSTFQAKMDDDVPWPGYPALKGSTGRDLSEVIEILATLSETKSLMCAATFGGEDSESHASGCSVSPAHSKQVTKTYKRLGLVAKHAYTLLRFERNVCGTEFSLVQLRNPWGRGEWKGAWGDASELWNQHPQIKAELNAKKADDGLFWMSADDFFTNFARVYCAVSEAAAQLWDLPLEEVPDKPAEGVEPGAIVMYKGVEYHVVFMSQVRKTPGHPDHLCPKWTLDLYSTKKGWFGDTIKNGVSPAGVTLVPGWRWYVNPDTPFERGHKVRAAAGGGGAADVGDVGNTRAKNVA